MVEFLISSTTILGTFLLALFAYFNNRKSATNILFAVLASAFAGVALGTYLATHTSDPVTAIFWVRVNMFFASIVISTLFLFIHTYPGDKILLPRPIFIGSVIWTTFLALICMTPLVFKEARFDPSLNTIPGPGIVLFGLSLFVNMGFGFYYLYKKYKHSSGLVRAQIQFLGLGLLTSFSILTTLNFLTVVLLKNTSFVNVGISSILIFIGSTAYAIVRHRLLDIRLVVARAVAYTLLVLIIATTYTTAAFIVTSVFLQTATATTQISVYAALTLIVALTFQPLRHALEHFTDRIFFKERYDSSELLSSLTTILATTLLLDDLTKKLLKKLLEEMRISRGAFILTEKGKVFAKETYGGSISITEKEVFTLQAVDKILVFEELQEESLKNLMRKLNITVSTPLRVGQEEIGLLLLGEKSAGDIYSDQDIKVLEIFAPEASIAIQNALSFEEIRRFNVTLRQEIAKATEELREANDKLKELDKLKDEFLSIASHDLRTPMAAIKSYIWMGLHGRAGPINEKLQRYLDLSYQSAERMINLINDLLNVSRIEAGRLELSLERANLEETIKVTLEELRSKATEKNINLEFKTLSPIPPVMLDKERFPEIITNLVGNSLKFTPEKGSITVTAQISKDKKEVLINVTDTGMGIAQKDIPTLFAKFHPLDKPYVARSTTGGTGLGLYITKNLVELHGGKIGVRSEVGKGSTFYFTLLPAKDGEKPKNGPAPVSEKEHKEGVYINSPQLNK